jgi:hypothetical protein
MTANHEATDSNFCFKKTLIMNSLRQWPIHLETQDGKHYDFQNNYVVINTKTERYKFFVLSLKN